MADNESGGFIQEFKEFIAQGSVLDLAVGIVIGGAFTAIVTSLVNDLIMPLVGIIIGGIDFSGLVFQVGNATLNYGLFIQAIINFLLIALVIFMLIKGINKLRRQEEAEEEAEEAAEVDEQVALLTEIRDELRKRQ